MSSTSASHSIQAPRLLDQLADAATRHGHGADATALMQDCCRRYVLFHGKRHPRELGLAEVGQFLRHVAATEKDALRALDAARNGLDFLYREVLDAFGRRRSPFAST
jgi:hypothetical protein